jgi:archaemetzincin
MLQMLGGVNKTGFTRFRLGFNVLTKLNFTLFIVMKYCFVYILCLCILLFACKNSRQKSEEQTNRDNVTIVFQPFSDMDLTQFKEVADSISKLYPSVSLNPPVRLPRFAYYPERGRYKADSLIKFLARIAKPNETVIGFTVMDISTTNGSVADWGVMGLSKCPGNACIVSTFRLNNAKGKNQLFKVAIHELGHTMGLPHCSNKECFMRDAEGANVTDEEKAFCAKCSQYLKKQNWIL